MNLNPRRFINSNGGTPLLLTGVLLLCLSGLWSCSDSATMNKPQGLVLADHGASYETRALYQNLKRLSHDHLLFGQQDALAYGVNWEGEEDRSDVRDIVGSHPAVYGWELGDLELGKVENLDKVNFARMRQWIQAGYQRGGVITISWHMNNPVTGGSSWDAQPTVAAILPGGPQHETLKRYLDQFAAFNDQLAITDDAGKKRHIPIIFRPWHEHNGDWFWWGKKHTREEDYITLWRFTVGYLRDTHQIHNLIYAFSPDRSRIEIENFKHDYLYAYPGDEYVDVIGLDNYWDLDHSSNPRSPDQQRADLALSLQGIVEIALERNKIAALTETGKDRLVTPDLWSKTILPALKTNGITRQLAYMMVWRNANREREGRDHFYVPYEKHEGAGDFMMFSRHPMVLFEDELPAMYLAPE